MTSTTIIIKHPNLTSPMITVDADSTVALVQHTTGSNVWYALLIDGRHYDLVMWKHTIGRPEALEGLQQALATVQAAITGLQAPATAGSGKEITYDRTTGDYKMTYEGALVGWAKTYGDAETTLDTYVYELLTHTAVESADQAAEMAEVEAEAITAEDDAAQRWFERATAVVAEVANDLPLAARAIPLAPGAHDLDDGDVQIAYRAALAHPEMLTSRWQNALNRAFEHLYDDRFVVAINNQGAFCWWPQDDGGSYAVTPGTCSCTAFHKDQPCRHRASAIILSLLPVAEESGVRDEIDEAYRLIMWEVERLAA